MVATGVLPVGAMRPRLSASSVTSRVVRGRLAAFRTASAAARKVISSDGNEGKDGLAAATSGAAGQWREKLKLRPLLRYRSASEVT